MKNKVCAIVGAGQGLGQALARRFAKGGYTLALVTRSKEGGSAALIAAKEAAPELAHKYYQADATKAEKLEETLEEIISTKGDITTLIYNVRGSYAPNDPLDISYKDVESILNLEVVGAFVAAKSVLPDMLAKSRGNIIFSSATAAFRGSGTNPLYAIGKFGLRGLSQSLAKAYGKNGVHVTHVRLDCELDVPDVRQWMGDEFEIDKTSNVDDVAETYWWTHEQPKSAWSNEIEIRPYSENWTY
ncbi:MAG: SDR family NAD(P)-dependent oxidoreductase [Gammaproteobacteria bacterium]|jgi:NAD(P)-dependent dehydrogenase (short-subunit alcohol dehydrogenase family)